MTDVEIDPDELPERGVRSRSGHARRVHRIDEDADDLRPACCEADRDDSGWKACDPGLLLAFERFSVCGNPPCFADAIQAQEEQETAPLVADGSGLQERAGYRPNSRNVLDEFDVGDLVQVAFFRARRKPDAFEGEIVSKRPAIDADRETSRLVIRSDVGTYFQVDFGGGVSRRLDDEPDQTIGYAAAIIGVGSL